MYTEHSCHTPMSCPTAGNKQPISDAQVAMALTLAFRTHPSHKYPQHLSSLHHDSPIQQHSIHLASRLRM